VSQSRPPTTPARQIGHISNFEPNPMGKMSNPGGFPVAAAPPVARIAS
jgi:hypothetical protein